MLAALRVGWHAGCALLRPQILRPNIGRFINKDPVEEAGGINLYSFVFNDPTNRADANGLSLVAVPVYDDGGNVISYIWVDDGRGGSAGISVSGSGATGTAQNPTRSGSRPSSPSGPSVPAYSPPASPFAQTVGNNNPVGWGPTSFYSTAVYVFGNTGLSVQGMNAMAQNYYSLINNSTSFLTIAQRSAVYSLEGQTLSNDFGALWFQAAGIVTGWNAVGAADFGFLAGIGGLSSDARAFLQQGNAFLWGMNQMNYELLSNGIGIPASMSFSGDSFTVSGLGASPLRGLALDYELVQREQDAV
jgi:hypothetical protein